MALSPPLYMKYLTYIAVILDCENKNISRKFLQNNYLSLESSLVSQEKIADLIHWIIERVKTLK